MGMTARTCPAPETTLSSQRLKKTHKLGLRIVKMRRHAQTSSADIHHDPLGAQPVSNPDRIECAGKGHVPAALFSCSGGLDRKTPSFRFTNDQVSQAQYAVFNVLDAHFEQQIDGSAEAERAEEVHRTLLEPQGIGLEAEM